jgi:wobble nucleotide-excising tRNase
MLERIVQIKSIGRFRDYTAKGDVTFRKLTLIYAENGRGKTTFCAILRSLQSGQPEFIAERKTLGIEEAPVVNIRLNSANYRFTNGAWTETHPDIIIFDPVFVNENVYSGEYVEHEHKKNLYRVIVGTEGVRLAREIDDLDRQIRDANDDLRAKKDALSRYVPTGITLEAYLEWQPVADVEEEIRRRTEEQDARRRAAAKADEIQAKDLFVKVQLPSLPPDFSTLLAKQLTDIMADAEAKVRRQIAEYRMGHQGEPWLSQGLGYVKGDRCPFCGQGLRANELIAAYRSYFSVAYRDLKQEVTRLVQRVDTAIGVASLSSVQQAIAANTALGEFWRQFTTVDLPAISFPDIQQKYTTLREKCLTLAKRKQDSPTEAVNQDEEFSTALAEVNALRTSVARYNAAVEAANSRVMVQKAAVRSQSDISALKAELAQLEARKKRFDTEVVAVCQSYQDAQKIKSGLEIKKGIVRGHLDKYCADLLRTYERFINKNLDQFNAGFRITNARHLYTGGTPSAKYQIEINNNPLDLGDAKTPAGTPCFKTALSSGDRSALALAFFLAVLKQDADIGRKIVVFDDPFSSMDCFRRTCTEQSIRRVLQAAQQVIVLSHEAGFLKGLRMGVRGDEVKALQMRPTGQDNTVITEWDINMATRSAYEFHLRTLLDYRDTRSGVPLDVAKAIRPFLEELYRVRFPTIFLPTDSLGSFVTRARQAVSSGTLQLNQSELNELEAINLYARQFQHGQSPEISEDELHGFIRRALKLVGGC